MLRAWLLILMGGMYRDNAEDMSIVTRFLEEVGLEEGQKEEIVAIITGMGELSVFVHLSMNCYIILEQEANLFNRPFLYSILELTWSTNFV
jgi:hypothetical protein